MAYTKARMERLRAARCPDCGACHHQCGPACFRVLNCGPLSGVYENDEWPPELAARHQRAQDELMEQRREIQGTLRSLIETLQQWEKEAQETRQRVREEEEMARRRWTLRRKKGTGILRFLAERIDAAQDRPFRWQHVTSRGDFWKLSLAPLVMAVGDCYLLYYGPGGRVDAHIDLLPAPFPGGLLRLNVVLKQARKGGRFHFATPECGIGWGQRVFLFRPDETFHWVTAVEEGERWVLTFGLYLPTDALAERVWSNPSWRRAEPDDEPEEGVDA